MQNVSPIVVILGHVDHGKTSLLDTLRKTNIAASEVGGITQSTRAFQLLTHNSQLITFIDTPGHAAFSQMRSRGGHIADIALLIVSGVDGVMPQTQESIATIKSANLPFIVVVTKTDLPDSSVDKIKTQLSENQVFAEGFGGDIPVVPVSAKTGAGLTDLLEMINLVSQLHPIESDPKSPPTGIVLESQLDAKKGPLAVIIVKTGTFSVGQPIYLGPNQIGKIKALVSTSSGERISSAPSASPVEVLGLSQVPPVGSILTGVPSSTQATTPTSPTSKSGTLNLILKTDSLGSLEAISAALPPEINIIFSGAGDITESDVLLAQSTNSILVGFGVKVPTSSIKLAETDHVTLLSFNVIYELLDSLDAQLHPKSTELITGQAQVLAKFDIDGTSIAGCKCLSGEVKKGDTIRLTDKQTRVKSLKVGKFDVESVKSGAEFGAVFAPFIDFKVGDSIIALQIHGTV